MNAHSLVVAVACLTLLAIVALMVLVFFKWQDER